MNTFNQEMKKYIVRAFAKDPSPTKVRRDFLHHFQVPKGRKRQEYKLNHFIRVNRQFEKTGSVGSTTKTRSKTQRTAENLQKIEELMESGNSFSVRNGSAQLSVSPSTFWRILRYDSKAKFYRQWSVQPLTQAHMEQRKEFCSWILEQPEDIVQKTIWTDEKFFVFNPKPNRKNDGKWCKNNPHQIIESNDRNAKKNLAVRGHRGRKNSDSACFH